MLRLGGSELRSQGVADGFIAKYDAGCKLLWSKSLGAVDASLRLAAVAIGPYGEVVVGGMVHGVLDLDGHAVTTEQEAPLLVSLDPQGVVTWVAAYGSAPVAGGILQLGVDDAGDIAFSGFSGVGLTIDGQLVISSGEDSSFIAKVSSTGALRFGYAVSNSGLTRLDLHPSGLLAVSSWTSGPYDVGFGTSQLSIGTQRARRYVAVLDSDGVLLWGSALDADQDGLAGNTVFGGGVAIDSARNVIVEHGNFIAFDESPAVPEGISKLRGAGRSRDARVSSRGASGRAGAGPIAVDSPRQHREDRIGRQHDRLSNRGHQPAAQ